jgi:hypothetical protein
VIGAGAPPDPTPDTLRAVLDSVFASPAYRWVDEPFPVRFLRDSWRRLIEWVEALRTGNPAAFRLFVFALLLVLILALAHGAWVVWRTLRGAPPPSEARAPAAQPEARDAGWYFAAADRAAAAGRTAEALQLAFVGLALTLDRQGLLRYHASKTPAECAREARLAGPDRERLGGLVRTLYVHAFGGRPMGADEYRRWRDDLGRPWHAPAH